MEPVTITYFVYGSSCKPRTYAEGTALYARAWVAEFDFRDLRWHPGKSEWVSTDYLMRLISRGEPDLENLHPRDLPDSIPLPVIK